jgi:hypothetical protein
MTPANCDVRFTPKSGHHETLVGCLLCATTGREHPQQSPLSFAAVGKAAHELVQPPKGALGAFNIL